MVTDGKDLNGLQKTNLKNLVCPFQGVNRDEASTKKKKNIQSSLTCLHLCDVVIEKLNYSDNFFWLSQTIGME